jgi:hypothetical protein
VIAEESHPLLEKQPIGRLRPLQPAGTPLKAEVKIMDGGNTEVQDEGVVSELCNTHSAVTLRPSQFPLKECASTLQSFLPVDRQEREAAGLPTQRINRIGAEAVSPQ